MKRKVSIIGAGESGTGAALLGHRQGYAVFVSSRDLIEEKYRSDLAQSAIPFEEGRHTIDAIVDADVVVKSPGVPPTIEAVRAAEIRSIDVIDELEFAFPYLPGKLIAITGTNGKTTVTRLTQHLIDPAGERAVQAGNIGKSLARILAEGKPYAWYVVEASSFQLERLKRLHADVGVLLNITPDHMDRYGGDMEAYADAKFQLVAHATPSNYLIYYAEDPHIAAGMRRHAIIPKRLPVSLHRHAQAAAFCHDGRLHFPFIGPSAAVSLCETALRGPHNSVNMMAAVLAAHLAGADFEAIKAGLASYQSAPHRLEWITAINGVDFINDSKATNVDAAMQALDSYDRPIIWLVGGLDKGNDYNLLRHSVQKRVKRILCLGRDNSKIRAYFTSLMPRLDETQDVNQLARMAFAAAERGDVVLLSPACASFDLFTSYEDRGDRFRNAVMNLKAEIENGNPS